MNIIKINCNSIIPKIINVEKDLGYKLPRKQNIFIRSLLKLCKKKYKNIKGITIIYKKLFKNEYYIDYYINPPNHPNCRCITLSGLANIAYNFNIKNHFFNIFSKLKGK